MDLNLENGQLVIVGAGQAGAELAHAMRTEGFNGPITLVGDEPYLPYRRPPLSKTFLDGETTLEALYLRSAQAYEKSMVTTRLNVQVAQIDRQTKSVRLSDGSTLTYDKLALTTGGRARKLPLAGADLPNVHYVRNIHDILHLKSQFLPGSRLVIIGGGYIGLEVASIGVKKGLQVCVVEVMPRVLARVTAPEMSQFFESIHHENGVDIRTGVGVQALEGDALISRVVLADGQRLPADLVIAGVGLIPNTELAQSAAVVVNNGIVVDAHMQTSDPDIVACGDCTFHENRFYQRSMRLESVHNALEQARVAAAVLCGKEAAYSAVPWFWSDQYDLKLQMVGLSEGHDTFVVRGDMRSNSFVAFYLKQGVVIAADAVNKAQEFMVSKRLVAERRRVTAEQLADENLPLKTLI